MKKPVDLRDEAKADLAETRAWYNARQQGLGEQFLAAMESEIQHIEHNPLFYTAGFRGVRKGMHRKYLYVIYYRILKEKIDVFAILHGHRRASTWTSRI